MWWRGRSMCSWMGWHMTGSWNGGGPEVVADALKGFFGAAADGGVPAETHHVSPAR